MCGNRKEKIIETTIGEIVLADTSLNGEQVPCLFLVVSGVDINQELKGVYITSEIDKWKQNTKVFLIDNSRLEWGDIGSPLVAIPSRIMTFHNSLVIRRFGKINLQAIDSLMRAIITAEAVSYYQAVLSHQKATFISGKTKINYAGRVYDEKEITNLVSSALDYWLTTGHYAARLERQFKEFYGSKKFLLVNSGSSANLLMVAILCSEQLDNPLKPGDEVVTPAVTFPTTLTPLLQYRLVPVFVDCELGTYNIDIGKIEGAISKKTRAIFVPHTLGNPCDMDVIVDIAKRHKLFLLEDSCDALGAVYDGRVVGTFGDMSSLSFYPAHHITMGEGGGVNVNTTEMVKIAASIRDWGRDCWCESGKNNTCGRRFDQQWGDLPAGYDHKYVYSNLGYNLKITDMQAAIGCAQFEKINEFIEKRRKNFHLYYTGLKDLEEWFILPRSSGKANPSWFGFPITVRNGIKRKKIIEYLESFNIETRLIFAGNILKQPGFKNIPHRVHGGLENTDRVMNDSFFLGVYPGLTQEMVEYIIEKIRDFLKNDQ